MGTTRRICVLLATILAMFAIPGCMEENNENDYDQNNFDTIDQAVLSTVQIKANDAVVFIWGSYSPSGYLRWSNHGLTTDGAHLSAIYKQSSFVDGITGTKVSDPGGAYAGQCVSMVKSLASRNPGGTAGWRRGTSVMMSRNIPVGTAIGTFRGAGGAFAQILNPNGSCQLCDHVGFFAGYAGGGFNIWDQNYGNPTARRHPINTTGGGNTTDAAAYYTLLAP